MSASFLACATALPEHGVGREGSARVLARIGGGGERARRALAVLLARSGVDRRHSVLIERPGDLGERFYPAPTAERPLGPGTAERMACYAKHAPRLALEAARPALAESGVEARSISHLVTVSCTGFDAPGFDLALVEGLEIDRGVARTHVGFMGCHGALNGLRLARAFCDADPGARVLLCAVELCSLHLPYGARRDRTVAASLFADGAAAVVVGPREAAPDDAWTLAASGSRLFPGSAGDMRWEIGDHGFAIGLTTRVPTLIQDGLRPWLAAWLAERGLEIGDVGAWAVHPGGPRILDAVERALDLPGDALSQSRAVLAELGNMSSPTILFVLERLRRERAARPCVALGFGPGLVVEAALLE